MLLCDLDRAPITPHKHSGSQPLWANRRQRRGKKPDTKSGQSRALWPEIRAAIAEGQSLRSIRQWLEEEGGVVVTVQSLGSYLTRIWRKEQLPPSSADGADFASGAHRIQGGAQGPEKKAQIRVPARPTRRKQADLSRYGQEKFTGRVPNPRCHSLISRRAHANGEVDALDCHRP
jgi:hypothetical protein